MFLDMNWQKIGMQVAPFLVSIVISVIIAVVGFRIYIAPGINVALEEATKTIKTLAGLGGIKKAEYQDMKGIEKLVGADLIREKLPELEALKLVLSPSTWEEIETTIEENPEAVIQLYEKYGHLLPGLAGRTKKETYMF